MAGRHLPQMLLATAIVVVLPLAVSLTLRASGLISSPWLAIGLTVGLSLAASSAGSAYWRKRSGVEELLFSELLLWGWVRRWRQERQLANAAQMLALAISRGSARDEALTTERREELLRQLARALEGQDVYLNGHSRRVARHATMIARGLGLPNDQVARIRAAAAVHDVGKLLTPKAILNKPGRLTDAEFEVIKRHPVDGAEMVAALGDNELTRIVRHHHERLDGAGYPDRLAGEQIPIGARIIAVADTFDAITSARAYRPASRHQKAIDILRAEAGSQLDPDAVRAFLAYYSGKRPTAVWALVAAGARHAVSCLSGDPAAAATISAGKLAAATAATVAIGAVAAGAPIPVAHASRAHAVARNTASAQPRATASGVHVRSVSAAPAMASSARITQTHVAHRARGKARGHVVANAHDAAANQASHASHAVRSGRHTSAPTASHSAGSPSGATGSPSPAATTPTEAPTTIAPAAQTSHPTPPGHVQTSNGNGNAYGHDNTHGNAGGNGQGNANGNGNSQGNGRGNGNGNGNGHANHSSQGNSSAAAQTTTTAAQTTTAAPTTTSSTTAAQPTGNGNSQGNSQGNGQDNGQGNGDNGNGKAKGKAAG